MSAKWFPRFRSPASSIRIFLNLFFGSFLRVTRCIHLLNQRRSTTKICNNQCRWQIQIIIIIGLMYQRHLKKKVALVTICLYELHWVWVSVIPRWRMLRANGWRGISTPILEKCWFWFDGRCTARSRRFSITSMAVAIATAMRNHLMQQRMRSVGLQIVGNWWYLSNERVDLSLLIMFSLLNRL